jgi:transposase
LPRINETVDELHDLLQKEPDTKKRQRLHALYLLQSQQASNRQSLAVLLGVHRNTIGRWLSAYERGGLTAFLTIDTPPGKTPLLRPEIGKAIVERLSDPIGLDSYKGLWQWVRDTYNVPVAYKTVYQYVRYQLGAKLKVARPSHIKKQR